VALAAGLVLWTTEGRRADVLRGLEETTRVLQLAIERELGQTVAALEALATSPALDEALSATPGGPGTAAFHAQAGALVERRPAAISVVWLASATGSELLINTMAPPGEVPPPISRYPYPPRPIGEPPPPGAPFREAIRVGRVHVGDLIQGPVTGWIIPVALPVRRGGEIVAVVAAGVSPSSLGLVLREQLALASGIAMVADRGGVIIARTAEEERFVGKPAALETIAFLRGRASIASITGGSTLDGVPIYAALRRLHAAPFAVGYGAPRAMVDQPLHRALAAAAAGALLALSAAVAAALIFGRQLGTEVAALAADAVLLARGESPPSRQPPQVQEVATARAALLHSAASLAESEKRFNRAIEAARMGTWEWDVASGRLAGSPGREALHGRPPGSVATIEALMAVVHPEDRDGLAETLRKALAGVEGGRFTAEFRSVWPDGTERWMRTQGRAEFAENGVPVRVLGAVVDVTAHRRAEAALRESEGRFRLAQEAAGIGLWERDLRTGATTWSEQEYRLFGLDPAKPPPDLATLREMILPEDRDRAPLFPRLEATALGTEPGPVRTASYRIRRGDTGAVRWIQVVGRALPGPDGHPARVIGVTIDVTASREAEERQSLLMREVDHRAKNALAVALSVVQLAPRDLPPEGFAAAVTGRIAAMARAHSLLAAERWSGADLRTLAAAEVAAHEDRVRLEGPPLRLSADAAQPVAMLLHELATNAMKHGALSAPEGRVTLSWRVAEDALELRWSERGGPPVAGRPERAGFGSRLLMALAQRQLGGTVAFDWSDGAGLDVTFRLPLRHLAAPMVGAA
jgi:PAS domain S-box-containing protein